MVFGPRHSIKLSGRIYSLGEIAGKKEKSTQQVISVSFSGLYCVCEVRKELTYGWVRKSSNRSGEPDSTGVYYWQCGFGVMSCGYGEKETFVHCLWECKLESHDGKQYGGSSRN